VKKLLRSAATVSASFLLLAASLLPARAEAANSTFFVARAGLPTLSVALDPRISESLGSIFFGLEAFRTLSGLPMALGVFSNVMMGGSFGGFPVIQAGVSVYYFPFSSLETSYSVDNEVQMKSSSWVPYLKFQPGFEFMNFRNEEVGAIFGSSSLMYVLSAGVMIPAGEKSRFGLELGHTSTLGATDAKENPISVSGLMLSGHFALYFD
jgi:hypothetical protein